MMGRLNQGAARLMHKYKVWGSIQLAFISMKIFYKFYLFLK